MFTDHGDIIKYVIPDICLLGLHIISELSKYHNCAYRNDLRELNAFIYF